MSFQTFFFFCQKPAMICASREARGGQRAYLRTDRSLGEYPGARASQPVSPCELFQLQLEMKERGGGAEWETFPDLLPCGASLIRLKEKRKKTYSRPCTISLALSACKQQPLRFCSITLSSKRSSHVCLLRCRKSSALPASFLAIHLKRFSLSNYSRSWGLASSLVQGLKEFFQLLFSSLSPLFLFATFWGGHPFPPFFSPC